MKDKSKKLQWFIDFIQYDLEKLEFGDELKLIADSLMMIEFGRLDIFVGTDSMPPDRWSGEKSMSEKIDEWTKGDHLAKCQAYLKKFFLNMLNEIEEARTSTEVWEHGLNNLFCFSEVKNITGKIRLELPLIKPDFDLKGGKMVTLIKEEAFLNAPIQMAFKASTDEQNLLFRFCQNLEGIPVGSFRQCPECERLIISTNRKKSYCTQKCSMKKINRERRQEIKKTDPEKHEAELKAGAKRARNSYVKKVKAKTSSKTKVGRRPTKHKDND